jgi:hypothetical protein
VQSGISQDWNAITPQQILFSNPWKSFFQGSETQKKPPEIERLSIQKTNS